MSHLDSVYSLGRACAWRGCQCCREGTPSRVSKCERRPGHSCALWDPCSKTTAPCRNAAQTMPRLCRINGLSRALGRPQIPPFCCSVDRSRSHSTAGKSYAVTEENGTWSTAGVCMSRRQLPPRSACAADVSHSPHLGNRTYFLFPVAVLLIFQVP